MFYNNSKNLSALALILAMSFSLANISHAQGVVTMVDEEVDELGLPVEAEQKPAENVQGNKPVENPQGNNPAENWQGNNPAENWQGHNPAENWQGHNPAENWQGNNPAGNWQGNPAENQQGNNPANNYDQNVKQELNSIAELEDTLKALNDGGAKTEQAPAKAPKAEDDFLASIENSADSSKRLTALGDTVLAQIDNELFTQMSDIEKQTTLLSLELRKEKLKTEVAAIKAQRELALQQAEDERIEREQRKKNLQTEKEIEKIKELQILEDKKAEFETLRQEKAVNDYKNKLFENEQKWVAETNRLYEVIQNMENERKDLVSKFERKFDLLKSESAKLIDSAKTAKTDHDTAVSSLISQNAQLKKRLEAEIAARENPFASGEKKVEEEEQEPAAEVPPALDYVIMEIRGKGDDLIAKLINESGESFLVKKGSILKTGHVINKITHSYIKLENNGLEDYLYFAAAGVVPQEPVVPAIISKNSEEQKETAPQADNRPTLMMDNSIPSLGNGMFVK